MRTVNCVFAVFVILICSTLVVTPAVAEDTDHPKTSSSSILLEGRHAITIQLGVLNQVSAESNVSADGVTSDTRVSGFSGSLSYSYWAGRDWSIEVSSGVIDAETMTSVSGDGVRSESAGVVPLLFGAAFHPARLGVGSSVRPYGSLAIGPYFGFATNSKAGTTLAEESVLESVLGFRVRSGVDTFIGERFRIGFAAGYHFVSDFDAPIGADRDYSGPEFALGFGILIGGGR